MMARNAGLVGGTSVNGLVAATAASGSPSTPTAIATAMYRALLCGLVADALDFLSTRMASPWSMAASIDATVENFAFPEETVNPGTARAHAQRSPLGAQ
jgi:hypothetical protein